ncbi:MAG: hypothetical protein LRS49_00790 [Desulfurococcales archaeon]|nr:hypothetical protein [Desulfurococcales archaeon]
MAGRSGYARLIPAARVAKTRVPPPERVRDALATPEPAEAMAAFRDYIPGLAEAKSPEDAGAAVYSWLAGMAWRLSRLAPGAAAEALLAFALDEVALDMLIAMEAAARGSRPESMVTSRVEWTPTARLAREPELLSSPERVVEAARGFTGLQAGLSWALQAARQARDPRVYTLAYPAVSYMVYTAPLASLDPLSVRWITRIVCPGLAHRAARAAAQAVLQGVDPRLAAAAIPRIRDPYCGIPWASLGELAEREAYEEQVVSTLRQLLPGLGVEGKTLAEALEASHRVARSRIRAAAHAALTSYPFHAGVAAAALALAKLAAESVRGVVNAVYLRLHPDEYAEPLGVEA